MQLRPRQYDFVQRLAHALRERGNTLGIAPTGFGKTVAIAGLIQHADAYPALVLQHRDELVLQNRNTLSLVAPKAATSLYTARSKAFSGGVTFGMVQSLVRNLDDIPALRLVVIDEAHHAAANSYLRVLEYARRKNPQLLIAGVTATPARGDRRNLRATFDNVADEVSLAELIAAGLLVKPRTFIIDIGVTAQLSQVAKTADEFDMNQVAAIMDRPVLLEQVFDKWAERAGERRTVVFCATVMHARHAAQVFRERGIKAAYIYGDMPAAARAAVLAQFDAGDIQVLCNAFLLTEGWDCQPASCCVLLRPSSHKSTMIQMIGRVLRKVDPERYPGIIKDDALVLDFGTSLLTHGDLDAHINLKAGALPKDCPQCAARVPAACDECPLCGFVWRRVEADTRERQGKDDDEAAPLPDFVMTEIDLMQRSPYAWETLDSDVTVANGITAWACCLPHAGHWWSLGATAASKPPLVLACTGERLQALASADDFLRLHGDPHAGKKKRWLQLPMSENQAKMLGMNPMLGLGITRYRAACMITWRFNLRAVYRRLTSLQ